jgi:hypothetical protein
VPCQRSHAPGHQQRVEAVIVGRNAICSCALLWLMFDGILHSWYSVAKLLARAQEASLTLASLSPNHMVSSSGPLTEMKLAWHSLAIACRVKG